MSPENVGMTNGGVKIKQELEDIKYYVIHQQQSSDAMMLIASVGGPAAGVTSGMIAKKHGIHLSYKFVLEDKSLSMVRLFEVSLCCPLAV